MLAMFPNVMYVVEEILQESSNSRVCKGRFSMDVVIWSNNNPVNDMTAYMNGILMTWASF